MTAPDVAAIGAALVLAGVFLGILTLCAAYVSSGPHVKAPPRSLRCRLGLHPWERRQQANALPLVRYECRACPRTKRRWKPDPTRRRNG